MVDFGREKGHLMGLYSIEKSIFIDLLEKVIPIVPTKTTIQLLSDVKIKFSATQIEIMATDLEQYVVSVGTITGDSDLEITINAKRLYDIIKELSDTIEMEIVDNVMTIKSDSFVCKMTCSDSNEYPKLPVIDDPKTFDMPIDKLKDMIKKSSYAVSDDELKGVLCGVLWDITDTSNGMVGTDGHRLGLVFNEDCVGIPKKQSVIMPKSLQHLSSIAKDSDKSLQVTIGEKYISFVCGSFIFYSKLIDGTYPAYEKVIPKSNPKTAIINKANLLSAIKRVSVLANQKTRLLKFSFTPSNLEIEVKNRESGCDAKQSVVIEYTGDDNIVIGFNASYLQEIISMIPTQKIQISMNTKKSPCLISPFFEGANKPTSKETFLVMPLLIDLVPSEE